MQYVHFTGSHNDPHEHLIKSIPMPGFLIFSQIKSIIWKASWCYTILYTTSLICFYVRKQIVWLASLVYQITDIYFK
jgi:hypothetical protein